MPEEIVSGGKTRMKTSTIIFSAANVIGLLLCIAFVRSIVYQARMEQRDYYDFGDSLTFLTSAGPVVLVCFILNVSWCIKGLLDVFRRRNYQTLLALAAVAVVWVASFVIIESVI